MKKQTKKNRNLEVVGIVAQGILFAIMATLISGFAGYGLFFASITIGQKPIFSSILRSTIFSSAVCGLLIIMYILGYMGGKFEKTE